MSIYDDLLHKVQTSVQQKLDIDAVLPKLKAEIEKIDNTAGKTAAAEAYEALLRNKDNLRNIGRESLNLLLFQISLGKKDDAINTYIASLSDPDAIIAMITENAYNVIAAKKKLDELHSKLRASAIAIVEDLALSAARLLPYLLSFI